MTKRRAPLLATVFGLAVGASACVAEETPVGQLNLPLVSTGSDGSLYMLPEETGLTMVGGQFRDTLWLTGDTEVATAAIPIGSYTATLYHPVGYTQQWPLRRQLQDGSTEDVMATLVSPQPMPFAISEGETTSLVLQFEVQELGPVTFGQGGVEVTVAVDAAMAGGLELSWSFELATTNVSAEAEMPVELEPHLPVAGDTVSMTVHARVTDPWVQQSLTTLCAPASFTYDGPTGQPLLYAMAVESEDPLAYLCIRDRGTHSQIDVLLTRNGGATTELFDAVQETAATGRQYVARLVSQLDVSLFDGELLDLSALAGTRTAPALAALAARGTFETLAVEPWITVELTGTSELTVIGIAAAP